MEIEEIAEITEIVDEILENEFDEDIENGLEIVGLEMGHVLEELKENIERLSFTNPPKQLQHSQILHGVKNHQSKFFHTEKSIDDNSIEEKSIGVKSVGAKSVGAKSPGAKPKKKKAKGSLNAKSHSENLKIDKPNYQVQKVHHNGSCYSNLSKSINSKTSSFDEHQLFSRRDTSGPCKIIKNHPKKSTICQQSSKYVNNTGSRPKKYNGAGTVKSKYLRGNDVLKELKEQVETAVREKKTFTICGNFYAIRRALLSRGWVEKMRISFSTYDRNNLLTLQSSNIQDLLQGLHDPQKGYIYKRMIMTKMLGQNQVDFYWDQHFDCFRLLNDRVKYTMVNRFKRDVFNYTTKQGLCESMKYAYWFQNAGISWVRHPRSYNLSNNEDPKEFISDFKLTAAMSILKWVVRNRKIGTAKHQILSDKGRVPISAYHFAATEVTKAIRKCNHEDIDFEIEEAMDYEWNAFLEHYYKIVHIGNHFKCDGGLVGINTIASLQQNAKSLLTKVEKYWPHLKMDGIMNVWILKPTNGCRGQGIYLCRTLQYILKIIKSNTSRKYIIQKYIERPFLVCNTKFDIRQWFLISCASPLTIWVYKDCYLRFSSQLYSLNKLHESIHLTNNSIQSRYKNCRRNPTLPECNMWDSHQFKRYLAHIGYPSVYEEIIYPGIKECLRATIVMNQNNLDTRRNCFELYGSDFMLTEDFKPWLIEINARPALYSSTPVTARLCPQVLEDLIKVIIDTAKNPDAPTGQFELLYKEKREKLPPVDTSALNLKVQELPTSYFYNPEVQIVDFSTTSVHSQTDIDLAHLNIKKISTEMKKTLENLLSLIQTEREKRKILKNNFSQAYDIKEIYTCKTEALDSLVKSEENKEIDKLGVMPKLIEIVKSKEKQASENKKIDELNVMPKPIENNNWELCEYKENQFSANSVLVNENNEALLNIINNSPSNSEQKDIEEKFENCQNESGDLHISNKESLEETFTDGKNDVSNLKYNLANKNFEKIFTDSEKSGNIAEIEEFVPSSSSESAKLRASKSIFRNIINSLRNISFSCKNNEK